MALEKLLKLWQEESGKGLLKALSEKRKHARLVYPAAMRPVLEVSGGKMEVLNISEKGMKILNFQEDSLARNIHGTVRFSSGMTIDVTGKLVWQHKKEVGMLVTRIPRSVILDEVRELLRLLSKDDPE